MKKFFTKICALVAVICMLGSVPAEASDDCYGFTFTIKIHQGNTIKGPNYRQTSYVENPWKVYVAFSGEGRNSITTFWLEGNMGTNVSPDVYAVEAHAPYYSNPYAKANKSKVWLAAENNNYVDYGYSCNGYWDEETWD